MNIVKKHKRLSIFLCIILSVIAGILLYINFESFRQVINIIIISFIIAYILKPVKVALVKRFKIKDSLVSIIIILGIVIAFSVGIFAVLPTFFREINNIGPILSNINDNIEGFLLKGSLGNSSFIRFLYEAGREEIDGIINSLSEVAIDNIISMSSNLLSFAIVPVVIYYFLSDYSKITNKFYLLIPLEKRNIVKRICKDIDKVLSQYILGQLFLSLIITILTFIILMAIKVRFPLWLSFLNGIFNVIPYFGPFLGGAPVVFIALIDEPIKGLWALIGMIIIQQVEGNILSPKITADSTDMHPLIIIILLLFGEKIGGIVGMILIIPIAVIFKVIYDDIDYYIF